MSIKEKIEDLFVYRKLPHLMNGLKRKEVRKLTAMLVDLQLAIYELDHYHNADRSKYGILLLL